MTKMQQAAHTYYNQALSILLEKRKLAQSGATK